MPRRKPIDAQILEAAKEFNAEVFAETVKGTFADLPDYRRNQNRVLYPVWYLSLALLCCALKKSQCSVQASSILPKRCWHRMWALSTSLRISAT